MTSELTRLTIRDAGGLRWIVFSRPKVVNAFDAAQWTELTAALRQAEGDERVRCIALRGEGRNFSAGYDLPAAMDELADAAPDDVRAHIGRGNQACWTVWNLKKPVIAAVEGYCLGGAFELAMACDFVVAEETAWFGEPEGRVAASAPFLITPWVMGMRHAKELLLTGDIVTAQRAERMGLLNEVCEDGAIEACVGRWSRKLGGFPGELWYPNKAAVNRTYEIMGFHSAIAMGEEAFVNLNFVPSGFKDEFAERAKRDGFSAALRWVQAQFE